jgi:heterodisulfide reductase subunit A
LNGRSASRGEGAGDRVGLFLCRCGANLGRIVGVDALALPARWPQAAFVAVRDLLCAPDGLAWLAERIRAERLDRIVIGACSPREHEAAFRRAAEAAGLSPWRVQRVNLREQVEWLGGDPAEATARAARLVRAGLARVVHHRDLPRREVPASPDVLVIGGGAAGLAAAQTLAGRGRRAVVVEREFALGGFVARTDAPLPDGACGSCVVSPVIDELLHHPAVDVLTGAEVAAVRGTFGGFDVEVRRRARRVDPERCLGCPACVEACPVEAPGPQRAIRLAWEGCLPYVPAIDPGLCVGLHGGACRACVDACVPGAIRLDEPDHLQVLHVGAIVVATGSSPGAGAGPEGERPAAGSGALAGMLRIAVRDDGFLEDAGPNPFEPTATRVAGVFVAGAAAGPRPLRAAIRDGVTAAGRILAGLQPGERLVVEPLAVEVDPLRCCGCGACAASCAFGAVRLDAATGKAAVEPLHCRACGSCAAGCPAGAVAAPHQSREELSAELRALLASGGEP